MAGPRSVSGGGRRGRADLVTAACLLAICTGFPQRADCSVHRYLHGSFSETGNAFLFNGGSEGLHASSQHSKGAGVDNGESFIQFDSIKFTRTKSSASQHSPYEASESLVQALIFEVADRDKIGGTAFVGRSAICCTPDLAKQEGCNQGEIIKRPSLNDAKWPWVLNVPFKGDDSEASLSSGRVNISKTGMYNLFFIFCDPQLKGLLIDGRTIWKNPSGYLPGRMAPLMTFYGIMSLVYLILGMLWLLQYSRFWKDILHLQNCITLVIALGMFEMTLWYFEYANFNATGHRPVGITLWAVTLGVVKKTVSRLLVLVVSMGYGVVRPTLGGLTSSVALLGATYFATTELLEIVENVGAINDLSGKARLFLALPVAILDAFFIIWIFTSLSKTLEKLQARKQLAKLEIYRKFTNALVVAVIASIAWIGYELYFKATDPFSERWQSAWRISAFWNMLSFALLCVICLLWAPSQNPTRFAYSDETGEDDEEDVALKISMVTDPEKGGSKHDNKERLPVNTDVFRLDDDTEEDKRE